MIAVASSDGATFVPAPLPIATGLTLRDYQTEAFNVARDTKRQARLNRALVVLPTGTGKTVIFAHITAKTFGRVLILVHRDELVHQTIDKIRQVAPTLQCGVVKATRDDVNAHVIVASVQTLSRADRLTNVLPNFSVVIVDEAHHATAESYRRVMEYMGCFDEENPTFTLGFTATPERGDKINLKAVWQEIIFHRNMLPMMRAGYLCDLKGKFLRLKLNLDAVKRVSGDFQDADLAEQMEKADAPKDIVTGWEENAKGRKTIVFTPTVAFAYLVANEFRSRGYVADVLHAGTPNTEANPVRRTMLQDLKTGKLPIIVNCGVLTEGFDEPSVNCIAIARPTQSRPFYTQMVGRGTRLFPGKDDCLILDFSGASKRYELVTLAKLLDLDEDELNDGATVLEAVEKRERAMAALQERVEREGKVVAQTVDLFNRKAIHWIPSNDGGFLVSIESGHMEIAPNGETYRVVVNQRDRDEEVLADGVSVEYAMGIAEDAIRSRGWVGLVKADAAWRNKAIPASQKQLDTLRKMRVKVEPGISKGEASDLLTKAFAERAKRGPRRY